MKLIFLTLLITLLGGTFLFSSATSAEKKMADVQNEIENQNGSVSIGDPKEIFVKKIPKNKNFVTGDTKRQEAMPKSFREFFSNVKEDVKRGGEGLKVVAEDMKQRKRHTFEDPHFIPPTRPDWR